jgi:hypothetical protein
MPAGINFGFGIQRLIDAQQRYTRATTEVYLRISAFNEPAEETTQWNQLGFAISPTGVMTGTRDILIDPPPSVHSMSLHNIGMSGGKLRFGAKQFLISATFVDKWALNLGYSDPKDVFGESVGLVNGNLLYSVEDIQHETVTGRIISWLITCNANEIR